MPKSLLSEEELAQLILSIVTEGALLKFAELLNACHEWKRKCRPDETLSDICEMKRLAYQDFDVRLFRVRHDGDSITEAELQLKRESTFLSALVNRNRPLVARLRRLLAQRYSNSGIEARDSKGGRQIHFAVSSKPFWWSALSPFEKWGSECAIYDEPFSSGQADPDETGVRNDFVIIRFRRKAF